MIIDERNSRGDIIRFEKHILTSDGKLLNLADNTNHGTLTDVTATTNQRGEANSAQSFNGTSSVITINDFTAMNVGSAMSAFVTVKPDDIVGVKYLLNQFDTSTDKRAWSLNMLGDKLRVYLSSDGAALTKNYIATNTIFADNVFARIGFVYSSNVLRLFAKGLEIPVTKTTDGAMTTIFNTDRPVTYGACLINASMSVFFGGTMCDPIVKNVAMSDEEVYDDYLEFLG